MGKMLNSVVRRRSKASKLKMVANLAVSRIAILTHLHGVRCSQARSDVLQLLHQGYRQQALLRVEQVIKEQNALDALVMIENCCHVLGEIAEMITNSRECPEEVKEVISSLIFAASRTGEFPELQEIRRVLTSKYGKDFAYCAVELRDNCRVYPKIVQSLSTERASLETRQNLLKQISAQGNRDGAAAAGDAFESAVELSRNESWDKRSDDRSDEEDQALSVDEEITESPNRYIVKKNAKMSEGKEVFG